MGTTSLPISKVSFPPFPSIFSLFPTVERTVVWLYQSSFDIRSRRVDFSVPKSRYCRKTKLLERGGGCAAQMRTLGVSAHHSKALQCIYLLPAIFVMIIPASAPVSAITACSPTSIFSIHFLLWARQFH